MNATTEDYEESKIEPSEFQTSELDNAFIAQRLEGTEFPERRRDDDEIQRPLLHPKDLDNFE
jgi:hypothetical protein